MASFVFKGCLFAVLAGEVFANDTANGIDDSKLRSILDELQGLANEQQQQIQGMKSDRERRLEDTFTDAQKREKERKRVQDGKKYTIYSYNFTTHTDKKPYSVGDSLSLAMDQAWLILCGALVFFMQVGFAMLQAGSVRVKNVQNALLKSLVDVTVGLLGWYIFGWSFAFSSVVDGKKVSGWVGTDEFAGHDFQSARDDGQQDPTEKMARFFYQWALCVTAATIASGGMLERVNFYGYCLCTFMMTAFIYPVVAGSTWGRGFLHNGWMNDSGFIDFAGSGIVHMTGGVAGLVGAVMVGSRPGRFQKGMKLKERVLESPPGFEYHSLPLVVLGTFIVWFGCYGFNCGSLAGHGYHHSISNLESSMLAAQIAMNTTISAAAGGITVFLLRFAMTKKYDVGAFCNGILVGLVSIAAGCGSSESGSAMVIGLCGGIVYQLASSMLKVLMIDDIGDSFAIHGAGGLWGVLAASLFDWGFGFYQVSGFSGFKCIKNDRTEQCKGLVDSMGKDVVASNFTEIIFILVFVGIASAIAFLPIKLIKSLKADPDAEVAGPSDAHAGGDKLGSNSI